MLPMVACSAVSISTRPCWQDARSPNAGLLAEADGGVLMLAMAERLSSATAVHVTSTMDARQTIVERDGLSLADAGAVWRRGAR